MSLLSSKQVIVRISIIIVLSEFLIMLALGAIPAQLGVYQTALLDVVLLAALASPAIYLWVIRYFVIARDQALAEVRALAMTDPLTKLANRRMLAMNLERFIRGCCSHEVNGALLLIDLDGFKTINDNFGHDVGDFVLIEVARRIESVTRNSDTAARLGGDEFVILISRLKVDRFASEQDALILSERLIKKIEQPIHYDEWQLTVSASIGIRLLNSNVVALNLDYAKQVSKVIADADRSMYEAKKNGKGHAIVYQTVLDSA